MSTKPSPLNPDPTRIARRWFFRECGLGLGSIALGALMGERLHAKPLGGAVARDPMAPRAGHFQPRAKRVVFLFMAGAPSHLDLFDHKPELIKYNGKAPPADLLKGYRAAFINPNATLLAPKYGFSKHGQSGMEISEVLPHIASIADDITLVRSIQTEAINHAPAQIFMNTGSQQFGRPSMGTWVTYGLGSESRDLPGFVVLSSGNGTSGGASNWSCGFLPTIYQGVPLRSSGDPVLYLSNPRGLDRASQRASLDTLSRLNRERFSVEGDPEIEARMNSFEMAYRMQASAPELMDLSKESPEVLALYGAEPGKASFANNCLLARRLLERGVRFVQLFHEAWDHHGNLKNGLRDQARITDRASAALVKDLKRRGLLDDTIVVWGGEFGRTPMVQGGDDGRDHHNKAYSMWLAGGGFKPGLTHGQSDEFGFHVGRDPVHVHDLHATLLHQLGFDHTRLTHRFQGREFRLTDVHGEVIKALLA